MNTEFVGSPWAFGPGDIRFYRDSNGNAQRDPGEGEVSEVLLQPDEEARLVLEVRIPASASGEINITPIASCPGAQPDRDNYARVSIGSGPALSLEKAAEPKVVAPGQEVRFTLRLRNNGNARANGPIYLTDALDTTELAGFSYVIGSASASKGSIEYSSDGLTWGASASPVRQIRLVSAGLASGEETFLIFRLRAADGAAPGLRKNTARAEGEGGPARAEQEFQVSPSWSHHLGPVGNPRALSGGEGSSDDRQSAQALPGQIRCFTHTLENSGTTNDSYTLRLSNLPTGVVGSFQTLSGTPLPSPVFLVAGGQTNFRVCLSVSAEFPLSQSPLAVTITARSSAGAENRTTDVIELFDPGLLRLIKAQNVSGRVEAEGSITYTLRLENNFPFALTSVLVEDSLDPNLEFISGSDNPSTLARPGNQPGSQVTVVQWALGNLEAGGRRELSLRVRVKRGTPEGSVITNRFSLRSAETPTATVSNTVSVPVESLNILLQKSVSPVKANWGDVLTYTLSVSNPFTTPILIRLVDTPPQSLEYIAGSSSLGEPRQEGGRLEWTNIALDSSQTRTVTYKMRVKSGSTGELVNVAQAISITTTASGQVIASTVASAAVALSPGVFNPARALVGRVFLDTDRDGRYTAGVDLALPGARVVLSNGLQALTDAEGRYSFRNPPGGLWELFLDPISAPFRPLPHPEALGEGYRHRVRIEGLTISDFPLELPTGYSLEQRRTILEFGPLSVRKWLLPLPGGVRVVLQLRTTAPLPEFELTDPLPGGGNRVFSFALLEGEQTITYDLPQGHLTDPQARWRYP